MGRDPIYAIGRPIDASQAIGVSKKKVERNPYSDRKEDRIGHCRNLDLGFLRSSATKKKMLRNDAS